MNLMVDCILKYYSDSGASVCPLKAKCTTNVLGFATFSFRWLYSS